MYKRFVLFIVLICFTRQALAQNKHFLDSIQQVLNTTKDTTTLLNCLYTLSYEFGLIEPRKGISYGYQCLQLAQLTQNTKFKLNAYNGLGNGYETIANFDSARYYHYQSYLIAKSLGKKATIAATLFNIAGCYKEQGDYRAALNMYIEAYKLIENEEEYNPRLHYYLSEMYLKIGNVPQASYHARLGIKKCLQWQANHVLPNMYIALAKCKMQMGQPDSAIFILKNALAERKKFSDQLSLCICLNALGEAYIKKAQYANALFCFEEELLIQTVIGNKNGICLANLNLAYCSSKLKPKTVSGVRLYLTATEKSLGFISHNKDVLMQAYQKLAISYEELGEKESAFGHFKSYVAIKDSLLNNQKLYELNELQTKYATAKNEKQIQVQKANIEKQEILLGRKRFQLIALISLFAFIILCALLFYTRFRAKQKIQLLLEIQRQEKLRENAIKEKETEERTRIAKDIHDELGSGISKIYLLSEYSTKMTGENVTLQDNLKSLSKTARVLADNMKDLVWSLDPDNKTLDNLVARINEYSGEFLEELPIRTEFNFPDDIPAQELSKAAQRNIFLTFKEALNNAVKHADSNLIKIKVSIQQDELRIEVSDNGKGMDKVKKTGNGLRNMQQRINSIGGNLKISTSPTGTSVYIHYRLSIPEETNTTFMG